MSMEKAELLYLLDDLKVCVNETPKEKLKDKFDTIYKHLIVSYSLIAG